MFKDGRAASSHINICIISFKCSFHPATSPAVFYFFYFTNLQGPKPNLKSGNLLPPTQSFNHNSDYCMKLRWSVFFSVIYFDLLVEVLLIDLLVKADSLL